MKAELKRRLMFAPTDQWDAILDDCLRRERARLDPEGTAKPKTEIVAVMPESAIGEEGKTVHIGQATHYVARPTEAPSSGSAERLATMLHRVLSCHDGYHDESCESFGYGSDADHIEQGDGASCDCGDLALREEARTLLKSWPFTSAEREKP